MKIIAQYTNLSGLAKYIFYFLANDAKRSICCQLVSHLSFIVYDQPFGSFLQQFLCQNFHQGLLLYICARHHLVSFWDNLLFFVK